MIITATGRGAAKRLTAAALAGLMLAGAAAVRSVPPASATDSGCFSDIVTVPIQAVTDRGDRIPGAEVTVELQKNGATLDTEWSVTDQRGIAEVPASLPVGCAEGVAVGSQFEVLVTSGDMEGYEPIQESQRVVATYSEEAFMEGHGVHLSMVSVEYRPVSGNADSTDVDRSDPSLAHEDELVAGPDFAEQGPASPEPIEAIVDWGDELVREYAKPALIPFPAILSASALILGGGVLGSLAAAGRNVFRRRR